MVIRWIAFGSPEANKRKQRITYGNFTSSPVPIPLYPKGVRGDRLWRRGTATATNLFFLSFFLSFAKGDPKAIQRRSFAFFCQRQSKGDHPKGAKKMHWRSKGDPLLSFAKGNPKAITPCTCTPKGYVHRGKEDALAIQRRSFAFFCQRQSKGDHPKGVKKYPYARTHRRSKSDESVLSFAKGDPLHRSTPMPVRTGDPKATNRRFTEDSHQGVILSLIYLLCKSVGVHTCIPSLRSGNPLVESKMGRRRRTPLSLRLSPLVKAKG